MKEKNKQKGITLVALVITIIIMLILAGITIGALVGDNGLFAKAKQAREETKYRAAEEKLILAISELQIEKESELELSQLNEIKDKNIKVETIDGIVNIYKEEQKNYAKCIVDEYEFKVYEDFKIALLGDAIIEETLDETSYIQDGLIVLYDGENNTGNGHDNTVGTWKNLAKDTLGTNDGTLMNVDFTEASGWTENSLILDGVNDWVKMQCIDTTNLTVEIVAKPLDINTTKMQYYISNCQNGGVEIVKYEDNYNNSNFYIKGSYEKAKSEEAIRIGQIYSMSTSYDGEKIQFRENDKIYNKEIQGTNTFSDNSTIFAIATNPDGNGENLVSGEARFNLEVYSVRIYNRNLTEEEKQHNYEIDKERYNIEKLPELEKLDYIEDGLICLYDGEQNTKYGHSNKTSKWMDLTGNNNDGTLTNVNYTEASGWTENSLILDGSNDWVKMKYLHSSNMTVEIVAKPLEINTSKIQYYIADCETGGMVISKNENNYNQEYYYIGGSYKNTKSEEAIRIGQIYSMSSSYDGKNMYFRENDKIYLNEVEGTNTGPKSSTVFAIGTNPYGSGESLESDEARFNLEVYSVRIYNRILTEEEKQHNYEIDKERYNIEKLPELEKLDYIEDGLICLYDGEQNTKYGHSNKTSKWMDLTGNNNDGSLVNVNYTDASGWTKNSLILDGSNDWVKMKYLHSANMTVEIVAKPLSIKTSKMQFYIADCETGGMMIRNNQNNRNFLSYYINGYKNVESEEETKVGQIYSMSSSYDGQKIYFRENDRIYLNEIEGTNTGPKNSTVFAVGTNTDGGSEELTDDETRFNLEVYSVRLYNRCLTEEEKQHNYEIDKQRFGIQ